MEVLSPIKSVDGNRYEVPLLTNNKNTNSHGIEKNNSSSSSDFVEGVVDYKGDKVFDRSKFGGWKSASLLTLISIDDVFVYYGMIINLISCLTGPLQQSTLTAAQSINILAGITWMFPLFTSLFVNSVLGRFRTILFSCIIYIMGFGFLTLSVVHPYLKGSDCLNSTGNKTFCNSPLLSNFFLPTYLCIWPPSMLFCIDYCK
ncbi:hypothetical protein C5167_020541 [Papaver somniferum]|uniref:Uncharacterized protein n=1 Tax=Papaver somniferum TaxID=3469 RepID=A0A4Y7ITV7_PAPSO|nr:protein NRT1/ PTR FAMILY 5.10-like [Papaver somniferum]RZC52117.1 hypothetical protein C5167_020541 [Papaver somniferum]